jgi:transglutaminase-like putative cysteine protease
MRYRVRHVTTYHYAEPVAISHNVLHLAPRDTARQRVGEQRLTITPEPALTQDRLDYFGNRTTAATVQEAHTVLILAAESVVDVDPAPQPDEDAGTPWEAVAEALRRGDGGDELLTAAEYAYPSPLIPASVATRALAAPHLTPGRPLPAAVLELTRAIHRDFAYDPKATTVTTAVETVLRLRRGVCQDFAQVMIAALRSHGLAARYVSGYLETDPPPGKPRLQGADASHAWVQVFDPALGWLDYDPTNGIIPGDRHVTVGWGRDFNDVSPAKGMILGGGSSTVAVAVDVLREPAAQGAGAQPDSPRA